jgi:nitrate reductase NapE component
MPIETNDFVPLLDWLLGPGWRGGALFQTAVILPLGLVAVLALAWLFFTLRTGSDRVSRIVGRVAAFGILALGLVGGLGAWAWWFFTVRGSGDAAPPPSPMDAFFAFVSDGAMRLLGEQWFQGSLYLWLLLLAVVMLASLVLGWLFALLRGGVRYATRTVDDALAGLAADASQISPRRV